MEKKCNRRRAPTDKSVQKKSGWLRFIKLLGPGLITGASDDDPSGIVTYSQAGSRFGLATLWTALITFPLMAALQEMCARIGLVTSQGLTVTLRENYPKWILYLMLLVTFPAITLNIGADIQGMGAVAHMIFPGIAAPVYSVFITGVLMYIIVTFPYRKIAAILKWLCISLLLYIIVPFMVKQNWLDVAKHTFIPVIKTDKEFISVIVAILGTTISPYLFFWQTTMEAEDQAHGKKSIIVNNTVLSNMQIDVNTGMLLSNAVMFFMILTAGSVLFPAGIHNIETVEQAAKALEPLAGKLTYLIFATGVLGTGMLAIPILAGSQSYMLAETLGWKAGLDKQFTRARPFYLSIIISLTIGMSLDFFKISPVKSLLYTAIVYGLTAPVLILLLLHIGNNKKIMKERVNSKLSNILGVLAFLLMATAAIILICTL